MRMIIENPSYKIIYIIAQEYLRKKSALLSGVKIAILVLNRLRRIALFLVIKLSIIWNIQNINNKKLKKDLSFVYITYIFVEN